MNTTNAAKMVKIMAANAILNDLVDKANDTVDDKAFRALAKKIDAMKADINAALATI